MDKSDSIKSNHNSNETQRCEANSAAILHPTFTLGGWELHYTGLRKRQVTHIGIVAGLQRKAQANTSSWQGIKVLRNVDTMWQYESLPSLNIHMIWLHYTLFDPTFYEKISAEAFEELFIRLHPGLPKIGWSSWSLQAWQLGCLRLCCVQRVDDVDTRETQLLRFQDYFKFCILNASMKGWMLDAWDKCNISVSHGAAGRTCWELQFWILMLSAFCSFSHSFSHSFLFLFPLWPL